MKTTVIIAFLIIFLLLTCGCINQQNQSLGSTEKITEQITEQITSEPTQITPTFTLPPTPPPIPTPPEICFVLARCLEEASQTPPQQWSSECMNLFEKRLKNDQEIMACYKNPYEAQGEWYRIKLQCMQGMINDPVVCAKHGVTKDQWGDVIDGE